MNPSIWYALSWLPRPPSYGCDLASANDHGLYWSAIPTTRQQTHIREASALALVYHWLAMPGAMQPNGVASLGGKYALGRAFLQAVLVGANWQTAVPGNGDGAWFLAQAPGPNTPSQNPATTIELRDSSLIGSENDWMDSWMVLGLFLLRQARLPMVLQQPVLAVGLSLTTVVYLLALLLVLQLAS
ncbi:hypothetical protein DL98DRAFT_661939 [Cadophora sp. DSE1049]|nr:hypothetical protein DL98DRAFT_661939 [Cadophora sp. DSE1049]